MAAESLPRTHGKPALRLAKLFDRLRWNTRRGCCGRRRAMDDSPSSSESRAETSSPRTTRHRRHTCEVLPQDHVEEDTTDRDYDEPASSSSQKTSSAEDSGSAPPAPPRGEDDHPKTNEYQLRVYRCLQCLHLPDWYVEYSRRNAGKGFLLKRDQRNSHHHWPGLFFPLGLSALVRPTVRHVAGKTPVRSVSDTDAMEIKKISKLSAATVMFRYRPPYLGWRSQERLLTSTSTPRTPAERLASGFKSRKEHSVFNRCYKCKTCNRLNHKGRHIFY